MLEIFQYSFMLRALYAGLMVAVVLGWLGTFVVVRKLSFIGEGIAHASLVGIAAALLLVVSPLPVTILATILIAIGIYFLQKKTNISGDMAIAIVFTSCLALGIILLHFYQGYQPELISYLFGNILTISQFDVFNILGFGALIILLLTFLHKQILFTTLDPIGAKLAGLRTDIYDLLLYVILAVAIVLSIKIVGIVLVSALLVTPSASAQLLAKSFKSFIALSIFISLLIVFFGLIFSYYLDLPSGATIVLTGTAFFFAIFLIKKIFIKN
jgi:zinc transport system permease protein